jgi:hypothetical protein
MSQPLVIRVRGGQTHVYAGIDITFDEDGTVNAYIELKGIYTAAGDDNWGDGDTTKPVIDFDNTAFQIAVGSDDFWKFASLEIIQSTDTNNGLLLANVDGGIVSDCDFHDNGAGGILVSGGGTRIENCDFVDNGIYNIRSISGIVIINDCVLNGGIGGTQNGLSLRGTLALITNTTFGVTTEHSLGDIWQDTGAGRVAGRNVILDSTTPVRGQSSDKAWEAYVRIEDSQQVHKAYDGYEFAGNVSRSTAVERSGEGGTDWSLLGEPNSNCGSEQSLYIIGDWIRGMPIYLDGTSQTITVYAYADSTGGGWTPDASEFRIEIEHLEGSADWDIDVSTDTFAAEDQWESFEITLTPFADRWK